MKALDSTRQRFDRAYVWQREYYSLQNSLDRASIKINNNIKPPEKLLELDPNFDKEESYKINQAEINDSVSGNQVEFDKYKLIFYALLAALVIVSTFLILIYLKRNTNMKYMEELEEKNIKIELQNEAFQEQTKHLENVNNVKDKLFSIVSHDLKDSLSSINGFIDL